MLVVISVSWFFVGKVLVLVVGCVDLGVDEVGVG